MLNNGPSPIADRGTFFFLQPPPSRPRQGVFGFPFFPIKRRPRPFHPKAPPKTQSFPSVQRPHFFFPPFPVAVPLPQVRKERPPPLSGGEEKSSLSFPLSCFSTFPLPPPCEFQRFSAPSIDVDPSLKRRFRGRPPRPFSPC